jgi:hypothetical protein
MQFRNFKSRCLKLLFWILLIVYPSVSRKILMLYKCVQIGNRDYMMWDTQVMCYTPNWNWHAAYGVFFGGLYIFGVPGLFFGLLYQSRHHDVTRQWLHVKYNPLVLIKTLKAARADYHLKGKHWSRIVSSHDEKKRIQWYLCNMNMRSPKTRMRIGFLYMCFHEDYWMFELFEFGFKLMMTGVMVHVKPGTVSQIIAGVAMCFIALVAHLIFQPYRDVSNNLLMGAGKMQLFLTLMLALLLKMEAPFFSGNAQMDETDIDTIAAGIISTSALLVLSWIGAVIYECATGVIRRRRERAREEEARRMEQKFKRLKHHVVGKNLVARMRANMTLSVSSDDQQVRNGDHAMAPVNEAGKAKKEALVSAQEHREDEELMNLRGFRAGQWKNAKNKVSMARIMAFARGTPKSARKKKTAVVPQRPAPAPRHGRAPSLEMKKAVSTWGGGDSKSSERPQPPPRKVSSTGNVKTWGGRDPPVASPPVKMIVKKSDRRLSVIGFEAGSSEDEDDEDEDVDVSL